MSEDKNSVVSGQVSSGVEKLIDQLREEGVSAGEKKANQLVEEATLKSKAIIQQAKNQASTIVTEAKVEANKIKKGGEDALEIAMRDIVLKLKGRLSEVVGDRVQHLIGAELAQEAFLKELIIEVAGRARNEANINNSSEVEIKLPKTLIGLDELRHHPLELEEGSLSHFILNIAADVLREGVTFAESDNSNQGLAIYLKDRDIVVDLTEERITEVLLEHLQPRFRAIIEGMVK